MAGNLLFYYFGDDEAYFRNLIGEFGRKTRMAIDFKRIYESSEKKIQSLFLHVYKDKPVCVFIDFSKNTQDYLHLARIISRTPMEHQLVTVGLVDYLSPQDILLDSITTGVNLTHIKSAEACDVIFDVVRLINPNEMSEHGFAKASLKEEWTAGIPVKVGYVHAEGLHFETDHRLQKGDRIRLNHNWTEKRVVPSKEVFVQNVTTTNLFYHFKYATDVEFLFVDEFLPPEGMDQERIEEKKKEREELIVYHRKQLLRWIDDNVSRSLEKKAKVLVVDRNFHFYDHQDRTDKQAYTIRCLPYLEDVSAELDRLEPQVIAFALEKEDVTDAKNNNEELVKLMRAIDEKLHDTKPFVIVFNSQIGSKEMQDNFGYPQIMATESEVSVELLLKMADIFEKKMAKLKAATPAPAQKPKKVDQKVFLKKTNTASIAEILIPIKVIKLSESDIIFQTDIPLTTGMNLRLTQPVNMFVNVQPSKTQGKIPEYQGLIHCLGESEKKELRRFVNSVFFRDHDAQVNAETEEFKKLNDLKLQERLEAERKAREAEEQAKAEANEEANAEKKEEETES